MNTEHLGLSKKTNVAIAGVAGLAVVKDVPLAIGAVVLMVLAAITYQFIVDYWKK